MLRKIIFSYLVLFWKIGKKKSNIIKLLKNFYILKLFNIYIKELNKWQEFEVIYQNNL